MNWLHKLKQKPAHVRDQIAFFSAGGVVAVVCLLWVLSVPSQLRNADAVATGGSEGSSTLFGTIRESLEGMTARVGGAEDSEKGTSTAAAIATEEVDDVAFEEIKLERRSATGAPATSTQASTTASTSVTVGRSATSTSASSSPQPAPSTSSRQPRTVQLVPVPSAPTTSSTSTTPSDE